MAQMPPLPQQADALRPSELMPFRSKKISILKSRALIPLVVTAIVCVALFNIRGSISQVNDIYSYFTVIGWFTVFIIFSGLYFYGGERKLMLWYLGPCLLTVGQLVLFFQTAFGNPYTFVFRTILPGHVEVNHADFPSQFIAHFFGAGMMEELIKAVPALIGLGIALLLRRRHSTGNILTRGLALEGPIDGLLVGAASGAGFILLETLGQYVPNEVQRMAAATHNDVGLSFLFAMMLLIPRVLNGVIGHMAWAGISGYFIGLVVSHPKAALKLLPVAWLLPAALHGFWNASGTLGSWALYVSAGLSLFFFLSCLLKAKQLEVSRLGGEIDGHSILAVTSPSLVPSAPAGAVPPPLSGVAGVFTGAATAVEKVVGFTARTTVPSPASMPPPIPASRLSIGTGAVRYALAPGQVIDFSALFGAVGVPPGFVGSIGSAAGGFDLRNTGAGAWPVTTPDGATMAVPPGGTVRAVNGARFTLGTATIDLQAY